MGGACVGEMCVRERGCVCVRVSRRESLARLYNPSCTEELGLESAREKRRARKRERERESDSERGKKRDRECVCV